MKFKVFKKHLPYLSVIFFFYFFNANSAYSQTIGAGIISGIENKVKPIIQSENKIDELKRQNFLSFSQETEKLNALRLQLNAIIQEKDEVMDELRKGRFCNGCSRTASQLRSSGTPDVEGHFRANGGTSPAKPELLKQKEEEFNNKIAQKRKEIETFEGAENEFTRKRADIAKQISDLTNLIERYREEIVEASKKYKDIVVNEAKSLQKAYLSDLMRLIASKHYIEDRIDILTVRLADLQKDETNVNEETRKKVIKKTDEEKNDLSEKVNANINNLKSLEQVYNTKISEYKATLYKLQKEESIIKAELDFNKKLSAQEVEKLQVEQNILKEKTAAIAKQIESIETQYKENENKLTEENKKHKDKIWELTINLSKRQEEAIKAVTDAFELRKKIIIDAKKTRQESLISTGSSINNIKNTATIKFQAYSKMVEAERSRLSVACRDAETSCYSLDTHGVVVMNWKNALSCIGQLDNFKTSGSPVYGCEEETAIYNRYYSGQLNGLSAADKEALQRGNNKTRYDLLFRKITN